MSKKKQYGISHQRIKNVIITTPAHDFIQMQPTHFDAATTTHLFKIAFPPPENPLIGFVKVPFLFTLS